MCMKQQNRAGDEPGLGSSAHAYERVVAAYPHGRFVLKLYVSGISPRSQRAIENLQKLCDQHLHGNYDLEIIDIYQRPTAAKREQIIAAPTLIKTMPLPVQRVIGDMGDSTRILTALGIVPSTNGK